MNLLKKILLVCVMTLPSSAMALEFSEFGIINLYLPHIQDPSNPSLGASGGFSFGGGITLGFTIWRELVIEPGLAYVVRSYSTQSDTQSQANFGVAIFQAPLVIRYWFTPNFSAGLGGYFAHYTGTLPLSQGRVLNEIGLVPTIRLKSPISDLMSAVLDGRFNYSLTNLDSSGQSTQLSREIQVWGGISFIL